MNHIRGEDMASIKEIAEKAGVSNATVSRVLNYDKSLSISDDKRKMIFEIAEEMNYLPPRQRKMSKRTKASKRIGMIHWYGINEELADTYYLSIRMGIEKECISRNFELVKVFRDEYDRKEEKLRNVGAIIAVGKFNEREIDEFKKINENIIFVDSSPRESCFDSVVIDFKSAMESVFSYLLNDIEVTDIGYIGGREYIGDDNIPLGERREKFFKEYLGERGLFKEDNVYIGRFLAESGYELMKQAISDDHLPRVFFVASDSMAVGAIRAIHEAGMKIPEDIGIIGFDDIPTASFTVPPLTTIRVHTEFMGETAVSLSSELIEGRNIPKKVIIPTKLIKRESM